MMAGIRGRDTSPEKVVRSLLHRARFRFRIHEARLPGRPDVVMRSRRIVVLINGCFWHRHSKCANANLPKGNRKFWSDKLQANVLRDRRNIDLLSADKWRVLVVWECAVRKTQYDPESLQR